jgi:lipoprotein NlpI/transglutaminase-like putative cysteine protease
MTVDTHCAGLLKALALTGLISLGLLHATPAWSAAAKPASKPAAAAAKDAKDSATASFSIAAAPTWVVAVKPGELAGLPPAPLQLLVIDRQTRLERGNLVRYQHVLRQINETAGLQKGAQIELEFDPSFQQLVLHQLDIWRDGKRINKLDRKRIKLLHREPQLERQLIDGRMTASVVLDDLRVGDRVEWAASFVGENPVFEGRFVDQEWSSASSGPVALFQYRLLAPPEREIRHRSAEPGLEIQTETRGGWKETLFTRRQVAQFHHDPLTPAADYVKDQIELSEFQTWGEVAQWADRLFARAMQPSAALDAQAQQIAARAGTSTEERLRLALDFVQQEVRYFGTESGVNSHQPASTEAVLKQRFGDCKDKAALLASLLHKLGLSATPALVPVFLREQVRERLVSPLSFDHAIVAVQLDDKTLWLDATRAMQTGAPAHRQSVGLGYALLAKAGSQELSGLPAAAEALRIEAEDVFSFDSLAEAGSLRSRQVFHGELAEGLREARAHMPAKEFGDLMMAETLRFYPMLQPQGEPEIEELAERNALQVVMNYRGGDFWQYPDKRALVGSFALPTLISQLRLPDQTPRSAAMRLGLQGRYLHRVSFKFGEDMLGKPNDSRFDESNEHFELHLRYANSARQQSIDGELRLNKDVIAAGQWSRYREQLNKVAPRLANNFSVPSLSPTQIAALREQINALSEQIRSGKLKVLTAEQAGARSKLLVMNYTLSAGHLPPKLRALALLEKAVQLDHLMQGADAEQALREALALDPSLADIHAALAVNALLQRRDAEAVGHANRALKLAPHDMASRYTRVYANYFDGQLAPAQQELQDILKSNSEIERSYGGIWLYLTARRLGQDGVEATRAVTPVNGSTAAWPYPVLQLLQGQLDFKAALAASLDKGAPDRGRECELYFYAAQKALLDQDTVKARGYLQKSLATGVVEFNEYAMAQRELERIGAR